MTTLTDSSSLPIEAARNEIKNLAADLHTLIKEVTGEDMKIGYSLEKYGGWGFSNKGHDYVFYKGEAVRRKPE